jgi:hypothetical protein
MNSKKFEFEEAEKLFLTGKVIKTKNKEFREMPESCKEYIGKYFYVADCGNYYLWDASEKTFIVYSKETIRDVYMNRLPDEVSHWFFKENRKIYKVVIEVNKPRVFDNKINMFYGFKYGDCKKYAEYPESVRAKAEHFLAYIKEVLCSFNDESYQYILKWTANVLRGNKNDSCLYLKGPEGIGKSTFSDFLMQHLLGHRICVKSKPDVLKSSYNKILCGKLLVVFEELPTFSDKEWEGVSSTIKDYVSGDTAVYGDKYEKSFEAQNINNYIINTNVDALKHSEGRRYYILDLSTKRKGDHAFFGKIKNECFNAEVAEALFAFFNEIDVSKFNAQKDMPVSQGKLNAIAERLSPEYKFLKEKYLFAKKGIICKARDLYDEYVTYCQFYSLKALQYTKFTTKLKEVNIEFVKSHGIYKYNMEYSELRAIADKNCWVHELDEFDADAPLNYMPTPEPQDTKDALIAMLRKEIEQLKAELEKSKPVVKNEKKGFDYVVEEEKPKPVKKVSVKAAKSKMLTVMDLLD